MNLSIRGKLIIEGSAQTEILFHAIHPENQTLPSENGNIESSIEDKNVITLLDCEMTLGRFIHTVDDIFKAALLSLNIIDQIED